MRWIVTKAPVRYGDVSTHDGQDNGRVVTASSTLIIGGRAAALRDDLVDCPKHGRVQLVGGDDGYTENGRPLIGHLCRTTCGAQVLASTDEFGV
ncbi:PAAR domain-containing protein [Ralstonia sp. 1138]|uniref:PAAR domain-containing protein n=1 Tax=Ralstonia sp. 1138 TaxID=3156423 RepID=UPI003393D13A